jgi:dTDP-D-glucose 4,6-dehydratase
MLLLEQFGIPKDHYSKWVEFSKDRPFNDLRYAVDCSKLIELGWKQRTSFSEGLQVTIQWYRQFGEKWWGDISHCLAAFPEFKEESSKIKSSDFLSIV